MSVQLKDIKLEIKMEETQDDNGGNSMECNNVQNTSIAIKKEYKSEQDYKFSHEKYNFVSFETIYVKEEKPEHRNVNEDKCVRNFKGEIDIDIKAPIKKEPMSDTETLDGSTNRVISEAEINESNENFNEHKFTCDICNDEFAQQLALDVHMLLHTDKKSYECVICKKDIKKKSNFDVHMRIHTGERPYECEICKNSFSTKAQLNVHMRIHSGEKPYECEICKKTFTHRGTLITHRRTHFGEKPYECEICKSKFRIKGHLNRHMRIHSGEETYKCRLCKDKFTRNRYLVDHMRIHTEKRPYEAE